MEDSKPQVDTSYICSHTSGTFCRHLHMCVFTGFCTFSLDIALRVMKLQLLPENCKLPDAMSISNLYRLEVLLTARSV